MTTMKQNSRKASQRLIGGDALFIGGMMLALSIVCRGFGIIGLVIGLLLVTTGGWLSCLARHGAHVPLSVTTE